MARKLKVYRTPIGFHDAYVAAPSQKAALAAWGSDANLFARGVAETVTEETLTAEPLAHPGTVIRRARGTVADHLAALPANPSRPPKRDAPSLAEAEDDGPPRRRARGRTPAAPSAKRSRAATERRSSPDPKPRSEPAPRPKATAKLRPNPKAIPRPSRAALDEAERTLEQVRIEHDRAIEALRKRERDLQQERRTLEHRREKEVTRQEAKVEKTRDRYETALRKWRG